MRTCTAISLSLRLHTLIWAENLRAARKFLDHAAPRRDAMPVEQEHPVSGPDELHLRKSWKKPQKESLSSYDHYSAT